MPCAISFYCKSIRCEFQTPSFFPSPHPFLTQHLSLFFSFFMINSYTVENSLFGVSLNISNDSNKFLAIRVVVSYLKMVGGNKMADYVRIDSLFPSFFPRFFLFSLLVSYSIPFPLFHFLHAARFKGLLPFDSRINFFFFLKEFGSLHPLKGRRLYLVFL